MPKLFQSLATIRMLNIYWINHKVSCDIGDWKSRKQCENLVSDLLKKTKGFSFYTKCLGFSFQTRKVLKLTQICQSVNQRFCNRLIWGPWKKDCCPQTVKNANLGKKKSHLHFLLWNHVMHFPLWRFTVTSLVGMESH